MAASKEQSWNVSNISSGSPSGRDSNKYFQRTTVQVFCLRCHAVTILQQRLNVCKTAMQWTKQKTPSYNYFLSDT